MDVQELLTLLSTNQMFPPVEIVIQGTSGIVDWVLSTITP